MAKIERKERYFKKPVEQYNGVCPKCREKGSTPVLPFGDDSFYCENPSCTVIRHSKQGYHRFTKDDIQMPSVSIVKDELVLKRESVSK